MDFVVAGLNSELAFLLRNVQMHGYRFFSFREDPKPPALGRLATVLVSWDKAGEGWQGPQLIMYILI